MDIKEAQKVVLKVIQNVGKVILGKQREISQITSCWLANGHALLEDVPGTGKTMLAKALAKSVRADNQRVQFTPDLLPSDIIGATIYSKTEGKFFFSPGPVFTSVLLADELNRATPRTQSALLEAMAEGQCTVEKRSYPLPKNFFVLATQNPIEQHGTFPLPEAQLDRFMMRLSLGYPDQNSEKQIITAQLITHPIETLEPVVEEEEWGAVRNLAKQIKVSDTILDYALSLVKETRQNHYIELGASPRATIALIRCGQAFAMLRGEVYIRPDIIKQLAPAILTHRIILTTEARLEKITAEEVIKGILNSTPVPTA